MGKRDRAGDDEEAAFPRGRGGGDEEEDEGGPQRRAPKGKKFKDDGDEHQVRVIQEDSFTRPLLSRPCPRAAYPPWPGWACASLVHEKKRALQPSLISSESAHIKNRHRASSNTRLIHAFSGAGVLFLRREDWGGQVRGGPEV